MAEPSSLYARVRMTPKAFAAFLDSPLAIPSDYDDWLPWLSTKRFRGSLDDLNIELLDPREDAERHGVKSVGDYLNLLKEKLPIGPVESRYDPQTETWTMVVAGLSDDYVDLIISLSILRVVARHKDTEGEDVILVYPYVWEDHPDVFANAYLVITPGVSRFVREVPDAIAEEANELLGRLIDEYTGLYDEDDDTF